MLVGDDSTAGAVDRSSTPRLVAELVRPSQKNIADEMREERAPGQDSFTAASRWGQHPCGPDVLEIEEFSNPKSTSGLPTYGTVSPLFHGVTIKSG